MDQQLNRRDALKTAAGAMVVGAIGWGSADSFETKAMAADRPVEADYKIQHGRIRQSVMGWCFNPMPTPELMKHCHDIGLVAIEGIGAEHYPAARKLGLKLKRAPVSARDFVL